MMMVKVILLAAIFLIGLIDAKSFITRDVTSEPLSCKQKHFGKDYLGQATQTKSGKTCQNWISQTPHKHNEFTDFPDGSAALAKNYCRNPDNSTEGPWCYTIDPATRWEYCDVPLCPNCRYTYIGQEYLGYTSNSKTGYTCQAWNSQSPHKHTEWTEYPDGSAELAKNYCRNPDKSADGPWCYTTDPNVRWEYCDIAICPECKSTVLGKEYLGLTSKTKTGKTCQSWKSQSPHEHTVWTGRDYPEGSVELAKNYCRNPDNSADGPWCYTTDKSTRWEYCDVPMCPRPNCKYTSLGQEYVGLISKTKTGKTCQAWTSQTPQKHTEWTDYPDGSAAFALNYCRNPDNSTEGPWCYTTDPASRWEYCDVPLCPTCRQTILGKEYIGSATRTNTGKTCQAWISHTPHTHHLRTDYPDGSEALAKNYCRNPDTGDDGPWCYTTDKAKKWEYCDVPMCPSCRETVLGKEYMGGVSKTKNGRICQAWTSQTPHKHKEFTDFPDGSAELAKNYCRNPDNSADGPWCYTTAELTRWEYCDIPICPTCKATELGKEYVGLTSKTKSGKTCQAWTSQTPQKHKVWPDTEYPDGSAVLAVNYCRNPDNTTGGPWCYTTDPDTRWEFCDVTLCP